MFFEGQCSNGSFKMIKRSVCKITIDDYATRAKCFFIILDGIQVTTGTYNEAIPTENFTIWVTAQVTPSRLTRLKGRKPCDPWESKGSNGPTLQQGLPQDSSPQSGPSFVLLHPISSYHISGVSQLEAGIPGGTKLGGGIEASKTSLCETLCTINGSW